MGMAELLQYENVAWYETGTVRILDRRVYPYRKEYVICKTYEQVAQAIRDMVTQSGGPYTAAAMGMVLAAWQCRDDTVERQWETLQKAAEVLSQARPTTTAKMKMVTDACLAHARRALDAGDNVTDAIFDYAFDALQIRYAVYREIAEHLVAHFPKDGVVMTQCFAETIVGTMLLACQSQGKTPRFICPETRPFLQGARLTASVIADMGFSVHVITDNMPGYILERERVNVFTSAADIITMDGHIVNKVGTFQIALAARHFGIPYYVTGCPNKDHPTADSVRIEERDAAQVLSHMGTRVAKARVKAYYPAFDIVPPELCNGVVTRKGTFSPHDLSSFLYEEEFTP